MGGAAVSLSRSVFGPAGKAGEWEAQGGCCKADSLQQRPPAASGQRSAVNMGRKLVVALNEQMRRNGGWPANRCPSLGTMRSHLRMLPNTMAWGKKRRKGAMAMPLQAAGEGRHAGMVLPAAGLPHGSCLTAPVPCPAHASHQGQPWSDSCAGTETMGSVGRLT